MKINLHNRKMTLLLISGLIFIMVSILNFAYVIALQSTTLSTQYMLYPLDANYDAIQNHVNGMSIADAEALSKDEKAVDAVSGATLVDTAGYVGVLVDAAK